MNRKKMLVLTGLFPHAQGNQSLLNSLIGYEKEYSILLLTVANLNAETYMPVDSVAGMLPKTYILSLWPQILLKYISLILHRNKNKNKNIVLQERVDDLINTKTTRMIRLRFFIRSFVLAFGGVIGVLLYRPTVICIYEINGMLAARWIKFFFKNSFIFGKFQGTVLGENLKSNDFFETSKYLHPFDSESLRYVNSLNGIIMTNDGTHGDKVLKKLGYLNNTILFIPNGVDQKFIDASTFRKDNTDYTDQKKIILQTISISRLIGWKRVDRIVDALAILKKNGSSNIFHTIVGGGDEDIKNYIRKSIEINELSNIVNFAGGQSIDYVLKMLLRSDLLISAYKPTNIANPVFEALAMGVPVLTIRDKNLLDVLGERANGCFFIDEPGSEYLPKALADKLMTINYEQIKEKRKILEKLTPPSWSERSIIELNYISDLITK